MIRGTVLRPLLSVVCLVALGCGGAEQLPVASVEGTVTLDGQALPGAKVMFTPTSGRSAKGVADSAGTFTLSTYGNGDGAIVGRHTIVVFPPGPAASEGPIDVDQPRSGSLLPRKYGDPAASGLTFEVKAGETNRPALELSTQPAAPK